MRFNVVGTLASGPVGGVVASCYLGTLIGCKNIICSDVGGTSFDVGLVFDLNPVTKTETVFNQYRLNLPSVDITSIGAGGGSIAWIEPPGILKVGPQSAGAMPGPACYGRGGTEPTASDACLLLGYLNPSRFWSGKLTLSREKAEKAISKVAEPLRMDVVEAAMGIYKILGTAMGDLISTNTVGRGYEPTDFALFVYGGAGGLFGALYGKEAGVKNIVVPPLPETFSALGIAISDIKHVLEQTSPSAQVGVSVCNEVFQRLDARAVRQLHDENVPDEMIVLNHYVGMKYRSQIYEVFVPVPNGNLREEDVPEIVRTFDAMYETLYGKGSAYKDAGRELLTLRVEAVGRLQQFPLLEYERSDPDASHALSGERKALWEIGRGFEATAIYDGERLRPGNCLEGPAIIEMPDTTVLVPPAMRASLGLYREIYLKEND